MFNYNSKVYNDIRKFITNRKNLIVPLTLSKKNYVGKYHRSAMTRVCVERSMHEERHKKAKSITTSADSTRRS